MTTPLIRGRMAFLIAGLLLVVALVQGQGIDSTLVGTVTDSSGAMVPGSQVTATNRNTGRRYVQYPPTGCGQYRMEHLAGGILRCGRQRASLRRTPARTSCCN